MNDNPHNETPGATPRRRIRDRYGRTVKVDKKTGKPVYEPATDNLNFTLYIKYVTGQKKRGLALAWLKRWAAAHPKERRKDIEAWLESEMDLPAIWADIDRGNFTAFYEHEISRSAKYSRSRRGKVKRKDDKRLGPRLPQG